MTTKTLYPQTLTQTSETNTSYREFNNLNNLKNKNNTYAKTGQIASKSGTHRRPSKITAKKFKAQLPTGSKINSITVEYAAAYEGNVNIGKSSVDLLNVSVSAKNGKALTKTVTKSTVKFTGNFTIGNVNSDNFGVTLDFPANTKSDVGYVKVQYLRIVINYNAPDYTLNASKVDGQYTDDIFRVKATINDKGKTGGSPNVTITVPSGATYQGKSSGDGSITSSGSTLTWKPGLTSKKSTSSIVLKFAISTDGNHNFKFSESVSSHSKTLNINTAEAPEYPDEETGGDTGVDINQGEVTPHYRNVVDEEFTITLALNDEIKDAYLDHQRTPPPYPWVDYFYIGIEGAEFSTDPFYYYSISQNQFVACGWFMYEFADFWDLTTNTVTFRVKGTEPQRRNISIWYSYSTVDSEENSTSYTGEIGLVVIDIVPAESSLTTPNLTIIKPGQEELNRLGEDIHYTVQSYLKQVTSETYVRDWYRNFRIGVFNNINPNIDTTPVVINTKVIDGDIVTIEPPETFIVDPTNYDNLTPGEIFSYAEYWSEPLTSVNTWESLSVEFPYNPDYPLYIIITGDYPEGSQSANTIQYTEPCIIESETYTGWETNGNYPYPIKNLLTADQGFSEISIESFEKSNGVIFFKIPIHEYLNSNDVVKGLSLDLDIEKTDTLLVSAKLRHPNGETGERSILTHPLDTGFSIGGNTDRWGFTSEAFKTVGDWEVEITINNTYMTDTGVSIESLNNAMVTIYYGTLEETTVQVHIDGENLSAYDFFLTDLKIPEGLETTTKFLNVDGTDLNEIYRQNIKEKQIEIDFTIDGCNIDETTQLWREFISLIVNERNELNKPIPKRIEFSNYPDVYWEYVMEEAVDYTVQASSYEGKLKLTVPAGTAFSKEETTTGTSGRVEGLAKVNPVITIIPLSDTIGLEETLSGQKFHITYTEWDTTSTVIIDCNNRTVTLYKGEDETDLTAYVDINCDWFLLNDEFVFTEQDCILQTVTWTERR